VGPVRRTLLADPSFRIGNLIRRNALATLILSRRRERKTDRGAIAEKKRGLEVSGAANRPLRKREVKGDKLAKHLRKRGIRLGGGKQVTQGKTQIAAAKEGVSLTRTSGAISCLIKKQGQEEYR